MTIHHATSGPPTVAITPDGTIHIYGPITVLTGAATADYVERAAAYGNGR